MAFFIFILLPLSEMLTYFMIKTMIGDKRALALTIIATIAGILLFKLRRAGKGGSPLIPAAPGVPAQVDPFLYKLASVLLIFPGFLTDILGVFLLIPAGRICFYKTCLRYFKENRNSIPFPFNVAPLFWGINIFDDSDQERNHTDFHPQSHTDSECRSETGGSRQNTSNSDSDDDIIDVDWTPR